MSKFAIPGRMARATLTGAIATIVAVAGVTGIAASPAAASAPACGTVLVAGNNWLNGAGVDVHSNGGYQGTGSSCANGGTAVMNLNASPPQYGYGWQCFELIDRLYVSKGWSGNLVIPQYYNGQATNYGAKWLYPMAADGYWAHLTAHANGSGYIPVPGDMLVISTGTYGHVLPVNYVSGNNLYGVEQNGSTTGQRMFSFNPSTGAATTAGVTVSGYIHSDLNPYSTGGTYFADGTYLQVAATGALYIVAGGSPMYVTSLSAVPWPHAYTGVTQAQIDAMPMYPADGTAIRNYGNGGIYVVAGGFPFAVTSLSAIPNTSWVNVDGWAINNKLRSQAADGTIIRGYTTGGIYVVSGGAAMAVASLAHLPSGATWTNIDQWAITNQLGTFPVDGSNIVDETGTVYTVAGHSALPVSGFDNIPPVSSLARVDSWSVHNQLLAYPVDGTVIRDYVTGSISVVAGGAPIHIVSLAAVPYTGWVEVDGYGINLLRGYPAAGTLMTPYQSGATYQSNGSSITQVTYNAISVVIDPWAMTHQL